jgi:hypothetical protein
VVYLQLLDRECAPSFNKMAQIAWALNMAFGYIVRSPHVELADFKRISALLIRKK